MIFILFSGTPQNLIWWLMTIVWLKLWPEHQEILKESNLDLSEVIEIRFPELQQQYKMNNLKWQFGTLSKKKTTLEISQNPQENTCVRVSFLIKLQAWGLRPATLFKKDSGRCFLRIFAKFLRTAFLIEHLWWLLLAGEYLHICTFLLEIMITKASCVLIDFDS